VNKDPFCRWCRAAAEAGAGGWFGQYAVANGELVHYVEAGSGEPVILLHGFMAWSYAWRRNLPALAEHARVLAPDLRGFGFSERRPERGHSLDDQMECVRAFMDALAIPQAVICGNSMGGEIALRLALSYPERVKALVLVSSAGYVQRTERPVVERWALAMPGLGPLLLRLVVMNRRFAARSLQTAFHQPGLVTEADVNAYLLPARVPGSAPVFLRMLRDSDFGRTAGRLGEITQRALLIWGASDPWIPIELGRRLASSLPHSELVVFEACGHVPQEECPEAFNQAVAGFLHSLTT
jgi:pimeloyl-ACP methyl ester carboxylesterase